MCGGRRASGEEGRDVARCGGCAGRRCPLTPPDEEGTHRPDDRVIVSSRENLVTYLSRSLRAVLVASLLLMALPLSAGATGDDDDGDQENTVEITIRGGDA